LFALAVAAGLRPCTGALLILLFTAANGVFLFGVASVFAMAIGVGTTVALIAAGATGVRAAIEAVTGGGGSGALVQRGLAFAAAGFIVLVGALAFLASLARLGV
jgi:ABC-type nickel/cobalt efflux system permease component RcnA